MQTAILLLLIYISIVVTMNLMTGARIKQSKDGIFALLRVIKEWAELGKRAHEAALQSATKMTVKTEEIKQTTCQVKEAVDKVPERVVEKIGESHSGTNLPNPWEGK